MEITYLAHACFRIVTSSGLRILTDPYQAGSFDGAMGYDPVTDEVDVVLKSHNHADHAYTEGLAGSPLILDGPGEKDGISFETLSTFHDPELGKLRGPNTVFRFEADGANVVFLGDLGHELDRGQIDSLKPVHVLLIPVGGLYTIDASQAHNIANSLDSLITVPMHFKTPKLGFDIAPVDDFLKLRSNVRKEGGSAITVDASTLPEKAETVVLNFSR